MRDTKPLLIILLAVGLVGTWVYHLYDKTQYSKMRTEVFVKDSAAIADAVRDSLRIRYTSTIDSMDERLASTETGKDSLKSQLDITFSEMNGLRSQINSILHNRNASREDLSLARSKINELQQKIDALNSTNNSITEEKSRLASQMTHLGTQIEGLQQNIQALSTQNQVLTEQMKLASAFIASDLNLNAVQVKETKEEITSIARRADKLIASFVVQNPIYEYSSAEVVIVVVQPDGNVLQISDWNTGNFQGSLEGLQTYTRVVKFDYHKGEQKQIIFSLNPEKFQKGTYKLQLWHKGVMIGQTDKSLS
jgi:predicted  nucleic acid-binding Zn-ribbon protein